MVYLVILYIGKPPRPNPTPLMPSSPFYMRRPASSSPPPEGCHFAVYAKNIFLTYPHCSLNPKYLTERLQTHCSNHNPNFVAAVRETHKDGSFHLHALVMCSRRIYVRSARWFDIDGFHPNFKSTRHPTAVYSYLKEGTPYEIGSETQISNRKENQLITIQIEREKRNNYN